MKILVTGANGYLGQGIVRQLLSNNQKVIATDYSLKNIDNRATKIECNLFELDNPYQNLEYPDVLLHLAWREGFIHNSNAHIDDLPKHYHFISNMINGGIKKIVVMGSMHEVGFFEGSINSDTPCYPMNLYGISKNALRNMVELLTKQYDVIFQWLRGYYIVGNSNYGNSIFSKITDAVQNGKTNFPFTLGQNQYDFLDYEQFCVYVAAAVEQNAINGIINICSGKPEKLADRVERFIKDNNYNIALQYGVFPDRTYDSKAIWGSNEKIKKILNNKNYIEDKR